jgi:ribonuclease HI
MAKEILRNLIIEDELELRRSLNDRESTLNIILDVFIKKSNYGYSLVTNVGKIFSIPFHESSYRAELFGMLAAVTTLRHIIELYEISIQERKKFLFYCNNKSVVKTINSTLDMQRTVNEHCYPDADIELQLMHELNVLRETKCHIEVSHIKGHQDATMGKTCNTRRN